MSSLKLNSLLEITKAINNNASTADLLDTYREVLREKLNIGKLVLFGYENKWTCLLKYGVSDEHTRIDVERDLLWISEINVMDFNGADTAKKHSHSFEIVIPVFHKQQPLAYVLIGDIDDDRVEVSPV